ncbi:DJ-1/PfpI family protein [Aldersonia sp. NBC_00410]|uniref:DJ-1/PfpI family protein n=1 Tax=Aldersonia sp. NBC_00410 TaxID=2975954 RepID=UPI00225B75D4|nr:DJ-1/PfpI family protein [Aldersonia sp. NBC_00410]MCX5044994.1 DJ-1/PfpI family protein [Aldersonia sp. NBC_00410]
MQIAIVLYPGVTALDAIGPYEVLRMLPDADLRFVWHEPGPIVADSGVLVLGATHSLDETPTPDIVLVPGSGTAFATVATDERLLAWLRQVHRSTTWTVSVCSGALVLGGAGLLDGLSATTHWLAQPALIPLGAKPQRSERIVCEGKIVTAAGASAGIDLALWLAGEIAGREHAEMIQLTIEYDPRPPFDAGHPSKASKRVVAKATTESMRVGANRAHAVAIPKLLWSSTIRRVRARR